MIKITMKRIEELLWFKAFLYINVVISTWSKWATEQCAHLLGFWERLKWTGVLCECVRVCVCVYLYSSKAVKSFIEILDEVKMLCEKCFALFDNIHKIYKVFAERRWWIHIYVSMCLEQVIVLPFSLCFTLSLLSGYAFVSKRYRIEWNGIDRTVLEIRFKVFI